MFKDENLDCCDTLMKASDSVPAPVTTSNVRQTKLHTDPQRPVGPAKPIIFSRTDEEEFCKMAQK